MSSYYDVLGVGVDADVEEVRRAYHRKAQVLHPDRYAEAPEPVRRRAEAEMQALNEAWGTLKDPEARRRYDLALDLVDGLGPEYVGAEYVGDEFLGGEDFPDDDEFAATFLPGRVPFFRRTGVRLTIIVLLVAGLVVPLVIAAISGGGGGRRTSNHSGQWSPTAASELRTAAVRAGFTATEADCFVGYITTRYSPADNVDVSAVQQAADACR
jgi:DnaJ-class molecular chaperone